MVKGAAASGGPMTYACADNKSWNFKNSFTFESTGPGAQIPIKAANRRPEKSIKFLISKKLN